jgi:hypothetical protein
MSRFQKEWEVVPAGAKVTAVLIGAAVAGLIGLLWLRPGLSGEEPHPAPWVFVLAAMLGVVTIAAYVLLIGYVWADAKRRGMNHVLWMLLAIFIPNAIGIILYFVLRDPVPTPCPACRTPARKGQAFCASCGAAVSPACPECRQPVEPGSRHCTRCGRLLAAAGPA